MSELLRRAAATERTAARYARRAFDWDGATCIHLARTQLRNMGHRPPRIERFYSLRGAVLALRRAGFVGTIDAIDSTGAQRIAPAAMLVGDLAAVPGIDGMDAIFVCAGGRLLGWHDAMPETCGLVAVPDALGDVVAAWRL